MTETFNATPRTNAGAGTVFGASAVLGGAVRGPAARLRF
jgi:hypothetical protein